MKDEKVPAVRAEAKRLTLKRYSRLRKQDLIELISNILDYPVPEIDAPVLTPTRYVTLRGPNSMSFPVRPQVEVNEQRRREIREIEEML